jgi:hypothetical protein
MKSIVFRELQSVWLRKVLRVVLDFCIKQGGSGLEYKFIACSRKRLLVSSSSCRLLAALLKFWSALGVGQVRAELEE